MTEKQRSCLPEGVKTNGSDPNPWWSNAVVYQIYPRSFLDSNSDGYGDLNGIRNKLPYLADLGVDVVWLSPVYQSPQDDNGYDISNYQDIDPMFGSMEDMEALIASAHQLGIKVVMDLVVNHTSDEHEWFIKSVKKEPGYADWYWWEDARPGHIPGTPGAEPNKWGSTFGGSAWEYSPERGQYFLHTFSPKQPDLNWENPQVRQAVYRMMNWWLDKGVDGFRMDVITLISKWTDSQGRLPGVRGSQIADLPAGEEGYSSPWPFSMDGPRLDEYLQEMRSEVFSSRQGYLTVGEAQGISPERNHYITDPAHGELDMLFLFDHMGVDQEGAKWNMKPLDLPRLKEVMRSQQEAVAQSGWSSLYFGNHDQPRIVSRWGDTSSESRRVQSAKALALLLHLHRGTPYIYQGEELGMTNAGFTQLDQYRDLESINAYKQRVNHAQIQTPDSMMESLAQVSRDNSRTPMQWDDSLYAGFEDSSAAQAPWIDVNINKNTINAASQVGDPDSVFTFYKKLINLRHTNPVVAAGAFTLLDCDDPHIYAFTRTLDQQSLLVVVNVSSHEQVLPKQSKDLLSEELRDLAGDLHSQKSADRILIANISSSDLESVFETGIVPPWGAFVYSLTENDKEK